MAFQLFSTPSILRLGLGVGLGISAATLHPFSPFHVAPMQCQYNAPFSQSNADTPWAVKPEESLLQKKGRTTGLTQELSLGSVLGLVAGVGLRAFSKALVVLLGMGVVLVEYAASKGYNILPLDRLQKYVKNVNLRQAMSEHRPFKMSFGVTMALAAFAHF
ncbi:hypothetical protein N7509_005777 [Penicillium cosmopolitanum]|uniref:FUN14 domain-containing protein n=1 Tax=Penicillium cosmopolitanum TaxID=1131564 RepID=A0A9W9W2U6_9EURO|nr:uncharacterized protein N7509_005777 [Penicillium cosmopolitanum]KAJ5397664.1 hypothetical protein N7509_005777 [Penicillium cosmopolitanum]